MSLPAHRLAIHPDWTLRISVGRVRLGYTASKTHLFDGVRSGCEYFRVASIFRSPSITFHASDTLPTCALCRRYSARTPPGVGHGVREQATARMITHALTTQDPAVASVTLQMLGAVPVVEPVAHMIEWGTLAEPVA